MNYRQLQSKLYGNSIVTTIFCRNHVIAESVDGAIFVDHKLTSFSSIHEAKQQIKNNSLSLALNEQLRVNLYRNSDQIVSSIKKHHSNTRITDTLIESYVDLAASKVFTVDNVVFDMKRSNTMDCLLEGRLDYKLNDGSTIVITEETQKSINTLLKHDSEVVDYMKQSRFNFLEVLKQLRN